MQGCISHDGLTESYESISAQAFALNAYCLFAASGPEQRAHLPIWDEILVKRPHLCLEVVDQQDRHVELRTAAGLSTVVLSDGAALRKILPTGSLYIDISGLAHHVWAPLIKVALSHVAELSVLYVEPGEYKPHPNPASATLFDLSEGFRGLAPLPSFANLAGPARESDSIFVPFLGFEGMRARYLSLTLDPMPRVIPILGVPGFRAEYPQISAISNEEFFHETRSRNHIRFARASCPFDAYSALEEIRRDHPGAFLYLAPIGTKPHALGAVWYAINHPSDTEIMYDHPVRKVARTSGIRKAHIYHLKPRDADI